MQELKSIHIHGPDGVHPRALREQAGVLASLLSAFYHL